MSHKCICCQYETFDYQQSDFCLDCGKPIKDKLAGKSFVAGFHGLPNPHKSRANWYDCGHTYGYLMKHGEDILTRIERHTRAFLVRRNKIDARYHDEIVKIMREETILVWNDVTLGERELKRLVDSALFWDVEFRFAISAMVKAQNDYSKLP